jgi:hypothetical protein
VEEVDDLAVGGAKVVTPGGDAVGLVDDEEVDGEAGDGGEALDVIEVLGRDEEEAHAAVGGGLAGGVVLLLGLIAVDAGGGQVEAVVEVAELVAHEASRGDTTIVMPSSRAAGSW